MCVHSTQQDEDCVCGQEANIHNKEEWSGLHRTVHFQPFVKLNTNDPNLEGMVVDVITGLLKSEKDVGELTPCYGSEICW